MIWEFKFTHVLGYVTIYHFDKELTSLHISPDVASVLDNPEDTFKVYKYVRNVVKNFVLGYCRAKNYTGRVRVFEGHSDNTWEFIYWCNHLYKEYGTFVSDCRYGKAKSEDIDRYIERWHSLETDLELHDYLGFTLDEYSSWVIKKTSTEVILSNYLI